ncbi:hypothetical protein P0D75_18410 [Paraburkholderia sediminicola]|uniref:hypothetical protein n=1 Tax=Paraburkholderia sediminicola TaxID=458836 RepID=UPI0038B70F1E
MSAHSQTRQQRVNTWLEISKHRHPEVWVSKRLNAVIGELEFGCAELEDVKDTEDKQAVVKAMQKARNELSELMTRYYPETV